MESGLEDRNNAAESSDVSYTEHSLNGVRPRRPEQSRAGRDPASCGPVSMESGLEDRNNWRR